MATFRNAGGEFRRPSGAMVAVGEVFTTTAREDEMKWPRKHSIGIRFMPVPTEDASGVPVTVNTIDSRRVADFLTQNEALIVDAVGAPAAVSASVPEEEKPAEEAAPSGAPVVETAVPTDEVKTPVAAVKPAEEKLEEWTAKITPQQYLERYGKRAPQSELAKAHVAAAKTTQS